MSPNSIKKFCLISSIALLITACAGHNPHKIKPSDEAIARIQAMPSETAIAELEASLAQLREKQHLNFFAPTHYELASQSLNDARRQLQTNASREQVVQKVATAQAVLRSGKKVAEKVRTLLKDEISIKNNLDELNTNELYANEYSNLLDRLSLVIRNIENGKKADAQELRPQLIEDLQQLEVRAVRHEALHDAEEILKRVTNSGGEQLAPNTYKEAQEVFHRAEEFIVANAHDRDNVEKVAKEALFAARRALTITGEVAALDHKVKLSLEQVVLDEEYRLFRIARQLGVEDPRTKPLEVQSEIISKSVGNVVEDRGYQEQMTDILRDAVVRQAELNNEPALLEEIKNLKRERSELLAKEALYSAKVIELRQQLAESQQRNNKLENKLNAATIAAVQSSSQKKSPSQKPDIVEKDESGESINKTIPPAALGAFANSEL